ncbi:hypothetical protein HYT91_00935 [Candidatus Pacearchaeota archaeon]|nr:hypothetical protein [Candidatus Pacearchaeota archaeon]
MIHILSPKEIQELLSKLNNQFGIQKISGKLIKIGKEKIFLFNGNFSEEQIKNLEKITFIEKIGVYIGAIFLPTDEIRLSIEGTQLFKEQIAKNIFEINEKQAEEWMQGQELNLQTDLRGIMVIKYKNHFLGCGKASENKIGNFIPKSRRLRSKNIIR